MAAIEPNPWFRVLPPEPMNDPPFNGALTGPINMPPRDAAPIAYFYLLFSIDLIKEFVKQTNRYAKNLCNETIRQTRRFSRKKQWQKEGKLTIPEFKGFLAVFFNMGLIRKVSIEEYWNKHSPSQSTPWFRCMFSRNRFQNILKFLHLVDTKKLPKRNDPAYRPSQRFKPLLDFVNRKFLRFYNPRRELSVDESLVGTKGKTSMLQYIPSKRSRFGVKFWMLVESVTGYVLQMDVYHGKRFDPTPAGTLQGTNVVMNLMKSSNLLGKGFHVFADSFFASLNLAKKLLRERTFLTGTMRKNRPMPQMIKNARPQAGNAVYSRQRQTMLCRFRDHNRKKPVTLVSTFYNAINTINCKPRVIGAYNEFMGGVDLSDQMIGAYNDHRKCSKVWKKNIYHIFHRIILNAYILYSQNTSLPVMTRLQFNQLVIESLASDYLTHRHGYVNRQTRVTKLDGRKERDCVVCSDRKRNIRKRSRTSCVRCTRGLHAACLQRHEC